MRHAVVALAALLLTGCVSQLKPAPAAQVTNGGKAAVGSAAGVTVTVRPDAWRGFPQDIESFTTPLLVTIDNQSGRPLRVRYDQFALVGPDGQRFAARSPYAVEGYTSERIDVPYASVGPFGPYGYSPYYADPFWPSRRFGSARRYGWNPFWEPWPAYRTVRLPTGDMVRMALPEAVVQPQSRVEGFVFFERATKKRDAPVDFVFDLVDAQTGEKFGTIRIPFVVD